MKNKKLAKLLPVIFFVELLVIHLVDTLFYRVIKTGLFDIAIILLLLFFVFIKEFGKGKIIGFIVLLVLIPALFVLNLPSITYEGGKVIVQNEINRDEVAFISTKYKLIPTTPLKSWFINDYCYHYEVEVSGNMFFYTVNPTDGTIFQLEEDFFRYTR